MTFAPKQPVTIKESMTKNSFAILGLKYKKKILTFHEVRVKVSFYCYHTRFVIRDSLFDIQEFSGA